MRRRRYEVVAGIACLFATTTASPGRARAEESPSSPGGLIARETAWVAPSGTYSVGVFNPLRVALRDVEIEAHPLLFLVAPHVLVRIPHVDFGRRLRVTGEYGVSVPTLAMRLAQGHLFPTWYHGQQHVGWMIAPRAGVVASVGDPDEHVVTLRVDLTIGIVLTHTDTTPLDTYAPLDLLLAPVTGGYRGRVGGLYDRKLAPRWRVRGYGDLYLHGSGELHDPGQWPLASAPHVTTRIGGGVDVALGQRMKNRLTLGIAWWNYDQHAIDPVTFERRRSNDILPTLDFIWAN